MAIVPFFALALQPVSIPAGSADVVIGTVAPADDAASLAPGEGFGGGAAGCLARVQRGSAWMDVCWQAYRLLGDEDGTQDYYALEVSGTAHGEAGSGIRWAVLKARGELPPSGVAQSWKRQR